MPVLYHFPSLFPGTIFEQIPQNLILPTTVKFSPNFCSSDLVLAKSGNAAVVQSSKLTIHLLGSLLVASYGRADTILSALLMNLSFEEPTLNESTAGVAEERETAFYFKFMRVKSSQNLLISMFYSSVATSSYSSTDFFLFSLCMSED